MTAYEGLSKEDKKLIDSAVEKLTVEMLEELTYGEEVELVEGVALSHYCEDDVIVINLVKEWDEILQVQWDIAGRKDIVFEQL
jgi:hypothetical protein